MQNMPFFVVPGNGPTLLGMPDMELLNILTISCNTIHTEKEDKDANCSTNRPNTYNAGSEQHCAITGMERSCTKTNSKSNCYAKTGSNSNINNSNAFIPMVNNNDIEYFLPGPSRENNRRASAELTK